MLVLASILILIGAFVFGAVFTDRDVDDDDDEGGGTMIPATIPSGA